MYIDTNKYILILIGLFVRASYQLHCLQCTSFFQPKVPNWDHSCIDGTVQPTLCKEGINATESTRIRCVSALYKIGKRENTAVQISRSCTTIENSTDDCDPPISNGDIEKTSELYCRRMCSTDGCNIHSSTEIPFNTSNLLKTQYLLLNFICLVCLYCFHGNILFKFN